MKAPIRVIGNDFAARFILVYLCHHYPKDIPIIWVKPPLQQQESSLALSPEFMEFLALIKLSVPELLTLCVGNFNCGVAFSKWPDAKGKEIETFLPFFLEKDLYAFPFQECLKASHPLSPDFLGLCYPYYQSLKKGECPVCIDEQGIFCGVPLGFQILSGPLFSYIDSFLSDQHQLMIQSEEMNPSAFTIDTRPSNNRCNPLFQGYSHFSHFAFDCQGPLPSHQKVMFDTDGILSVHLLPKQLSINWLSDAYINEKEVLKVYEKLSGIAAPSSGKVFESFRYLDHQISSKFWEGNTLRLPCLSLAALPLDFSLKWLFYSMDLFTQNYSQDSDNASFINPKLQKTLEELYSYFQLLYIPNPLPTRHTASTQQALSSTLQLLDHYCHHHGIPEDNWQLLSPTLIPLILSSRGILPDSYHPRVAYQKNTEKQLQELIKQSPQLQKKGGDTSSFLKQVGAL